MGMHSHNGSLKLVTVTTGQYLIHDAVFEGLSTSGIQSISADSFNMEVRDTVFKDCAMGSANTACIYLSPTSGQCRIVQTRVCFSRNTVLDGFSYFTAVNCMINHNNAASITHLNCVTMCLSESRAQQSLSVENGKLRINGFNSSHNKATEFGSHSDTSYESRARFVQIESNTNNKRGIYLGGHDKWIRTTHTYSHVNINGEQSTEASNPSIMVLWYATTNFDTLYVGNCNSYRIDNQSGQIELFENVFSQELLVYDINGQNAVDGVKVIADLKHPSFTGDEFGFQNKCEQPTIQRFLFWDLYRCRSNILISLLNLK